MRILVIDIAASKTGALSVLRDFYGYVRGHAGEDEWIFAVGSRDVLEEPAEDNIRIVVRDDVKASSLARLRFEFFTGAGFIRSIAPDVVISLENTMPVRIEGGIRRILYIHQPLGFQKLKRFSLFSKEERALALYQRFYHKLIMASAKRSDILIVQTEWMKKALIRDLKGTVKRIEKIGPDIPDLSGYVREDQGVSDRFFYPASDIPYKNHRVIDEAAELLKKEGISCDILYTKDRVLKREEVFEEYNRSTLIFPSYIETFGMPLAEARQFGTVILAADTEFAKEVLYGYDRAYYFDAFDAKALADLMKKVIQGELKRGSGEVPEEREDSYGRILEMIRNAEGQA